MLSYLFAYDLNLTVTTLTGKRIQMPPLHPYITVQQLKYIVREIEGIPMSQQRLVFQGQNLDNTKSLVEYGLCNKSMIYLVLQLRGGAGTKQTAREGLPVSVSSNTRAATK